LARVLQSLGVRRAIVVSGSVNTSSAKHTQTIAGAYLDELSTLGPNSIAEFYQERGFSTSVLNTDQFPLRSAVLCDLAGGDRQANAEIVRRLLRGEERGPKRDAILLNAATALFVAGRARTMLSGWELGSDIIDSGQALKKLQSLCG
jgi:anthranilate phosphoribosyltransferase